MDLKEFGFTSGVSTMLYDIYQAILDEFEGNKKEIYLCDFSIFFAQQAMGIKFEEIKSVQNEVKDFIKTFHFAGLDKYGIKIEFLEDDVIWLAPIESKEFNLDNCIKVSAKKSKKDEFFT